MPLHTPPATGLPSKPNLLFVITDQDRGLMHFPKGWELKNLKAMPRLRRHGITFKNAFCNSCMCSPSRATLFTGLFPATHGVTLTLTEKMTYSDVEPVLSTDTQNFARMLKASGYTVNYIGKWHLSKDANMGFDDMTTEDVAAYGFDGWIPPDAGEDMAPDHFGGGRANHDTRYISQAMAFLQDKQNNPTDQPWVLFVCLVNPHDVLAYPTPGWELDYADSYFEGEIELPATVNEDLKANLKPTVHQMLVPYLAAGLKPLPTKEMQLKYLNFYANLIQWSDELVNNLLDVLYQTFDTVNRRSLADTTLVIRTADHGEMGLTHNGLRQKNFNAYEESLSVPLVFSHPGLFPEPVISDQLISLVDLMPTIDGLLGLGNPLHYDFRGKDMSSVILGQADGPVQEAVLFTFDDFRSGNGMALDPLPTANRVSCIREANWKYAYYFYIAPEGVDPNTTYPQEYEMYDLVNNPEETDNLAHPDNPRYNNPEIAAERTRLQAALAALEMEKLK